MINCVVCGKSVTSDHAYILLEGREVMHVDCNALTARDVSSLKSGPAFETMTPNERQIAQHKIYNNS